MDAVKARFKSKKSKAIAAILLLVGIVLGEGSLLDTITALLSSAE